MEPLLRDDTDHLNMREVVQETQGLFGYPVVLLRFFQFRVDTSPDYPPIRDNTSIPTMAAVWNVTQQDILNSGGVFQAGDIHTRTTVDVQEYQSKPTEVQADMLQFEGHQYKLIGKPRRVFFGGGRTHTLCTWRRVD